MSDASSQTEPPTEDVDYPPAGETGCSSGGCGGENSVPEGQTCPPDGTSGGPVSYATGQMVHAETDLATNAFGIPWGHTRTYANVLEGTGGNGSSVNGSRWYVRQLKGLAFEFADGATQPTRVVVADGANSSEYFILSGGVYVNEFTGWNMLAWDEEAEEFTLTQARSGQQWVFYDHTTAPELRGQLKRVIDPAGRVVSCDYDPDGNLEKFEQVEDGQASGFYYTWTAIS